MNPVIDPNTQHSGAMPGLGRLAELYRVSGEQALIGITAAADGAAVIATGPNERLVLLAASRASTGLGSKDADIGAYARSKQIGVYGFSDGTDQFSTGVYGNTNSGAGTGVAGNSTTGVAILGESNGTGPAGRFVGNVEVTGTVKLTGDIEVSGDVRLLNGQDLAEDFEIADTEAEAIEPGSVLVFEDSGALVRCRRSYDRMVAGIVAGAGSFRPAIVLGCAPSRQRKLPLALTGKAYCRVDASDSPIAVGDLLTTSDVPGHAMKATDSSRAFGAVIGKALGMIGSGRGLIPVLVALQ